MVWGAETTDAIRANMFPLAQAAIDDWAMFPWHTYAASPRSSQVLAIDVFGSIRTSPDRDVVVAAIARDLELPERGPWSVELEWHDAENGLAEVTPTQVDAVAIGAGAIILFECKFTEGGGGCSQIKPDKHATTACDGSYRTQTNPQNGIEARCALTGKGMRYWDHISDLYGLAPADDHAPCPFAFDAYQWMRNVALGRALAQRTGKLVRVVAAYADAPYLQTAAKVKTGVLGLPTRRAQDAIVPMSYTRILGIAGEAAPGDARWLALTAWVRAKIEAVRPRA